MKLHARQFELTLAALCVPLNSPLGCDNTGKLLTFQFEAHGFELPEKTLSATVGSCDATTHKDVQGFKSTELNGYDHSRAVIRATYLEGNDSILCTARFWATRATSSRTITAS